MCGVIGIIIHKKNISKMLLKGIKKLEYRGYDSVGMAIKTLQGIEVRKDAGKIEEVNKKLKFEEMEGNIGIAHTRWATNGTVTKENTHPHLSMNNKIAVVHNGIVENYQEIKKKLIQQGFKFKSQTDTEVIPNCIEYFMKKGASFEEATKKTLQMLEGSFAIVALHQDSNTIIGARRGSPLVLGIGKDEFFLASDVTPFLECTRDFIFLDDDEIVFIDNDYVIYNLKNNEPVSKQIKHISWSIEQAQKDNYPHYMLKEINEQSFTVKQAIEQDPELISRIISMIKEAYGVFFVGCGSSYHACVSSSYTFAHIAKKHVNVVIGSEFKNYENFLTNNTLIIAVSQSGETADLLDAVKTAKKHGCKIVSICNIMGSTLTRISDETVMMNSGPEICVLSTKTYTAQLAILLLLAYGTADRIERAKEIINEAAKSINSIIENNSENLKNLAKKLKNNNSLFLLGRDLAYPSALEGALKIKEVSYIHAEGFAGGELKHGTIALIEKGTPVISLITKWTKQSILSNTMEVKSRGAFIIGINEEENELYDHFIKVPELGNANPIVMIIPIQILAYYLALERNLDPDKPRNLAKSVTVR